MPDFTVPPGWESDKTSLSRSFRDANGYEWQALVLTNTPSIWLVLKTREPKEHGACFAFYAVQDAINAAEALACGQWMEADNA